MESISTRKDGTEKFPKNSEASSARKSLRGLVKNLGGTAPISESQNQQLLFH